MIKKNSHMVRNSYCRVCRICDSNLRLIQRATLIGHEVEYYECTNCAFIQTNEPKWLDEAYGDPINTSDTGILSRNLSNRALVLATLTLMRKRRGQVVDFAGGFGILVRLLRDIGIDAFWADPYSDNLVARGFEFNKNGEQPVLVTAFEAFEHFVSPVEEMDNLLTISPNILFTTLIAPSPAPPPEDWWYYGLDHGQHVAFYRVQTLQYLADKFGLQLLSDGRSVHFFSKEKYSYPVWLLLMRSARYFKGLYSLGLRSKTWSDSRAIAKGECIG